MSGMNHNVTRGPFGELLQSAIPKHRPLPSGAMRANGLLLRGVVVKTYAYDAQNIPAKPEPAVTQSAIYCDVLVYSGLPGNRAARLSNCLVTQERSGLHEGDIWLPRATTMDITGATLNLSAGTDPADMDGDHVLIGFMDNDLSLPVVLRSVPHPRADAGTELPDPVDLPGQRMRIVEADGQPRMWRHRGTFFGVDDKGAFVIDTTRAHGGSYTSGTGAEPAPDDAASRRGPITVRMPENGQLRVEFVSDPDDPTVDAGKSAEIVMTEGQLEIRFSQGDGFSNSLLLSGKDGDARLFIGDGARHVAIVEHLQQLYEQLKARLDAFDLDYALHTHQMTTANVAAAVAGTPSPTLTPVPPTTISAPGWNSGINSSKVSIPDG